eukprot:gene11421-7925_t
MNNFSIVRKLHQGDLSSVFQVTGKDNGSTFAIKKVSELLRDNIGFLSETDILSIFIPLLQALLHLQQQDLFHGSISPKSIFFTEDGTVKLGDFGFSRVHKTEMLTVTRSNNYYDSIVYMSPEFYKYGKHSHKSDMWAAGCVLYELMMLKLPFDGSLYRDLKDVVNKVEIPPIPEANYSKELRAMVWSLLSFDANDRISAEQAMNQPFIKSFLFSQNFVTIESEVKEERDREEDALTIFCFIHKISILRSAFHLPLLSCQTATKKLVLLAQTSNWKPAVEDVRLLVADGANIFYKTEDMEMPLLHTLIVFGNSKAVEACLETTRSISFKTEGAFSGETPLHLLCHRLIPDDEMIAMTKAVLSRLETHFADEVDWGQKDFTGKTFLSLAAEHQKLCLLWPLVNHFDFFSDNLEPFPLRIVWAADLDKLEKEKIHFDISEASIIPLNAHTAHLCKLSWSVAAHPDAESVRKCVSNGADVMKLNPVGNYILLHYFVEHASIECVEACLSTPQPIDFALRDPSGNTVLHCLCHRCDQGSIESVLRLVLERLDKHPEDTVNWRRKDRHGHTFLSIAARWKVLARAWITLKESGKCSLLTVPIQLTCKVHESDWNQLLEDDKAAFQVGPSPERATMKFFVIYIRQKVEHNSFLLPLTSIQLAQKNDKKMDLHACNEATLRLFDTCLRSGNNATADEVYDCVRGNADILYHASEWDDPILHCFVKRGNTKAVAACLTTTRAINFAYKGGRFRQTVLHLVCQGSLSCVETASMLSAIVERIETHPGDVVQWGQEDDYQRTALSYAVQYQKLNFFWSIVRNEAFFADSTKPISLKELFVWKADWDSVGDEQHYFSLEGSHFVNVEESTSKLCQQCWDRNPDAGTVLQLVHEGANILFQDPIEKLPLLHRFIADGHVECVSACLCTSQSIDFSTPCCLGCTPLHYLILRESKPEEVRGLLHAVLNRLDSHPSDRVNWDHKAYLPARDDRGGYSVMNYEQSNFISIAAQHQMLSVVWPIVKHRKESIFGCQRGRYPLNCNVDPADWNNLDADGRGFFRPLNLADLQKSGYTKPLALCVFSLLVGATARLLWLKRIRMSFSTLSPVTSLDCQDAVFLLYRNRNNTLSPYHSTTHLTCLCMYLSKRGNMYPTANEELDQELNTIKIGSIRVPETASEKLADVYCSYENPDKVGYLFPFYLDDNGEKIFIKDQKSIEFFHQHEGSSIPNRGNEEVAEEKPADVAPEKCWNPSWSSWRYNKVSRSDPHIGTIIVPSPQSGTLEERDVFQSKTGFKKPYYLCSTGNRVFVVDTGKIRFLDPLNFHLVEIMLEQAYGEVTAFINCVLPLVVVRRISTTRAYRSSSLFAFPTESCLLKPMPDSEDASLSSSAMLLFCSASNWNPDPTKLLQYVESGADVLFTCRRTKNTIFHTLVERSRVRAVEVCLSTHNPMNFTLRGSSRMENPLHISCQGFITDEDSLSLLSNPDPFMVTTCVEQGADVSFRKPAAVCSILHTFILEGSTACLKALLQTPRAIDFTERGIAGRTPIHDICASNTFEKVEEVLDTILDRLDNHSCDKVDWTIKDKLGRDFISIVSEQKLLSIVWPILKRRKQTGIALTQWIGIRYNPKGSFNRLSVSTRDPKNYYALKKNGKHAFQLV